MRLTTLIAATAFLAAGAGPALAQAASDELSPLQVAVACAPPPVLSGTPAPGTHRVVGSEDTVSRSAYTQLDRLVIDGGTDGGFALGQRYFLRRQGATSATDPYQAHGVQTAGWIRIVAVNKTTAIAAVDHACGPIFEGDELAPFTAPTVPADAETDDASGQPDFSQPAHALFSSHDRQNAGAGEFILIDGGGHDEYAAGRRVAFFRDVTPWWWAADAPGVVRAKLPVAAVAEGVVVTSGPAVALVRITSARDAVVSGDLVVPRK